MTLSKSLKTQLQTGMIGGVGLLALVLVGMVESFNQRFIIADLVSMGLVLLFVVVLLICYRIAKLSGSTDKREVFQGVIITGITACSLLTLLLIFGRLVNLRYMLLNASPDLYSILNGGIENFFGFFVPLIIGALCGICAGILYFMPKLARRTTVITLCCIVGIGMLQDLFRPILSSWGPVFSFLGDVLFTQNGLTIHGAILIMIAIAAIYLFWTLRGENVKQKYKDLADDKRRKINITAMAVLGIVLLILPHVIGLFLSEVIAIVGVFVLLGLGLNIVVGFAGMLDLGYVAFFAIGAYTIAILTSPELGALTLSFWQALPIAILLGIIWGAILGIPVLKMRGDYLAIATLGFGEIIRILVLSDWLKPFLGGAQGITKIPGPVVFGFMMKEPQHFYYLILAGCILIVFISIRLRDSKLGRAWMALREDEDVAQAMGINLVATKLLAFATGAGFSALGGAISASRIGSVFPHSFNLYISIYVICLIIVGGMGSLPGVVVGAIALVGLPELLREFGEYRMFIYGAALVAMMLIRPEGLWPESKHKLELHGDEENGVAENQDESAAGNENSVAEVQTESAT